MKKVSFIFGIFLLAIFVSGMGHAQTIHFIYTTTNYNLCPIVIQTADILGQPLESGDEIGVFDGNLCVGAITYTDTLPLTFQAHGASTSPPLPGYTTGNPISFRVWDASLGIEAPAQPTFVNGNGTFNGSGAAISALGVASIPTVGEWGMIILALLTLGVGAIMIRRGAMVPARIA
ncbi:MAG: hypothetical protein B6244_13550 [Candidatus Cloacimonetes bacterium 4572_55]|nr:MAG: hypothetical protein B6244_13550 [Candidatus Cloacimonetes bacterium 4572_55]